MGALDERSNTPDFMLNRRPFFPPTPSHQAERHVLDVVGRGWVWLDVVGCCCVDAALFRFMRHLVYFGRAAVTRVELQKLCYVR